MFSNAYTPARFERDCEVVMVPEGVPVELPSGTTGYITQSLGGSFTIYVDGRLFRLAGDDADAIGKEPPPRPTLPDNASDKDVEDLVWAQLRTIFDPEIPINIVDLGLIYQCDLSHITDEDRRVDIAMTLTAPGCGMGEILVADVRDRVQIVPTIKEVNVALTFDPPWSQAMMSEAARLETGMF
ncbi:putative Fe-S cluster assembly protein SufT [Wenzhouxiangella limi]|uniref:Putative Fe-S cluster assembly protein SufT n=1 Tax=Wenzhouxiangella limi TaxID=2707351 RepID=A0A845UZ79_9GAMM|nr:putative Fe-S cluster assembly protein SufT [Wenzhouxiangella limi]NDY95794.1 putative Fe-S cluster assembly protein SufT [Wenzhouxiangella limi]